MTKLKKIINLLLRFIGLRLTNYKRDNLPDIVIPNILNYFSINNVIDIGANKGQFAERIIENGYKKNIYSIEPIHQLNLILKKKSKKKPHWKILEPMVISNNNGLVKFFETKNTECSSTLPPINKNLEDYATKKEYDVNSITLSRLLSQEIKNLIEPICLKLDTQGNELDILKSGEGHLKNIKLIVVEVCFSDDYKNQSSFINIYNFLIQKNFKIWSIQKVYEVFNSGKTEYVDLFFLNKIYVQTHEKN